MKLLPCAYCGKQLTIRLSYATMSNQYCQAVCENTKCPQNNHYETTEEAIKAYNTRHYPTCKTCKYGSTLLSNYPEKVLCTQRGKGKGRHESINFGCIHHEPKEEQNGKQV